MATLKETALAAASIIFGNEGGYGSVNKDDCGALSVGKLQWHGARALALLRVISKKNPEQARTLLDRLYDEVMGDADWSGRTVTAEEAGRIASLLLSEEGKKTQDEIALNDIESDIFRGVGYGLRNCGALIYFADGANQYGRYSALWQKAAEAAVEAGGSLSALHGELCKRTTGHLARRQKVYDAVRVLPIALEVLDNGTNGKENEMETQTKKEGKESSRMTHAVVRGDTLSAIARRYGSTVDAIYSANVGRYPTMTKNYILCGWVLDIPNEADGVSPEAADPGNEASELRLLLQKAGVLRDGESLSDTVTVLCALGRLYLLLNTD